jgi:hypothetical protein
MEWRELQSALIDRTPVFAASSQGAVESLRGKDSMGRGNVEDSKGKPMGDRKFPAGKMGGQEVPQSAAAPERRP